MPFGDAPCGHEHELVAGGVWLWTRDRVADCFTAYEGESWNSKCTDYSVRRCRELERNGRPVGVSILDKDGFTWENSQVDHQLARTTDPEVGAKTFSKASSDQLAPSAHHSKKQTRPAVAQDPPEDPEKANGSKISFYPQPLPYVTLAQIPTHSWTSSEEDIISKETALDWKDRKKKEKQIKRQRRLEAIETVSTGKSNLSLLYGIGTCEKKSGQLYKIHKATVSLDG